MKTGILGRKYQIAKVWYNSKKNIIRGIAILLCLVIACIFTIYAINDSFGGFKQMYSYPEEEYKFLESMLKSTIISDPYKDLKKIDNESINYTCNYESETEQWKVTLLRDGVRVNADITFVEGQLNMKVTYNNKAAHVVDYTICWVVILIFAIACLYYVLAVIFFIMVALIKFICFVEKLIISIKQT